MYAVSAAYKAAMNTAIQRHRIRATSGNIIITNEDILKDSMTLQAQASDPSDLSLGAVYISTLKFTLLSDKGVKRGTWRGRELSLSFSQLLDHTTNTWETIPVGVYTIAEANHTERGIEVTAYDHMAKLDEVYPGTETNGSPYDIMKLICRKSLVEFGMEKEEVEALPNGTAVLGIYPENDCKTWRDVAHYVAQVVGCFVTADRQGRIVLRRFGKPADYTVDATKRLTGSKFCDYETNYTGVSVVNMADKSLRSKSMAEDNGATLALGNNPLLQYGTEDTIGEMLENILQEINGLHFIPFSSSMVGNPALDLGDVITYTQGTAGEQSKCCLMQTTWKFNKSYAVQGFGKNPNLANAQSKAEKAIGGINSQSKSDTVQLFTYENAKTFNIGPEEWTKIADLRAVNVKETFLDFWIEIKAGLTVAQEGAPAVVTVRYIFDDNAEQYEPVLTFSHSGTYTFNLLRVWKLEEILQHKLAVMIEIKGGSLTIAQGDIMAVLKGQGLAKGEVWDGTIPVEDAYSLMANRAKGLGFTDAGITFQAIIPEKITISDHFVLDQNRAKGLAYFDRMELITQTGIFNLITEDGRLITTEDGSPYLTDGGGH